jgi:hypothetical protein
MTDQETCESQCPKCRAWVADLDGFGVLHCPVCGFCAHPCYSNGVCGICGKPWEEPLDLTSQSDAPDGD